MNPYRCYFIIIFRRSYENPWLPNKKKKKKGSLAHQEAPNNILFDYDSRTFMVLNLLSNKSKLNYFLLASSRWLAYKLNPIIGMSLELGTYQTHSGVAIETHRRV